MDEHFERGGDDIETVQLYGSGGASTEQVKQSARQGLHGSGTSLPYLERIQQAFGPAHDLSDVQAHIGGPAAEASRSMNARAYATGNAVAFRDRPDLKLAAHEAAHVVQQRAGVSLSQGVGQQGDPYERMADAVAERVASGGSAAGLLPQAGESASSAVQRYMEPEDGSPWRISDDGTLAVSQEGGAGGQMLLAAANRIDEANAKLEQAGKKGSFIRLESDGQQYEFEGQTLEAVKPVYHDATENESFNTEMAKANKPGAADATGDTSDKFAMYADCGRSSRSVMGSTGEAPKAHIKLGGNDKELWRSFQPGDWTDATYLAGMKAFLKNENKKFMKEGVHYKKGGGFITPKDGKHAKTQWGALKDEGKNAFAMSLGINQYANPEIGGGYTMATGYDLPGFAENGKKVWNFHWAGVIMKAGTDNVTLENYAVGFPRTGDEKKDAENRKRAYDWTNKSWLFQLYGVKFKGQSFHEQHLDTGTHGTQATSFAVDV
jgi:hypothetical protein